MKLPFDKLVENGPNFSEGKLAKLLHQEVSRVVGVGFVVDGFSGQNILKRNSFTILFQDHLKDEITLSYARDQQTHQRKQTEANKLPSWTEKPPKLKPKDVRSSCLTCNIFGSHRFTLQKVTCKTFNLKGNG